MTQNKKGKKKKKYKINSHKATAKRVRISGRGKILVQYSTLIWACQLARCIRKQPTKDCQIIEPDRVVRVKIGLGRII